MKKNNWKIISFIIVSALLGFCVGIYLNLKQNQQQTTQNKDVQDETQISSIVITPFDDITYEISTLDLDPNTIEAGEELNKYLLELEEQVRTDTIRLPDSQSVVTYYLDSLNAIYEQANGEGVSYLLTLLNTNLFNPLFRTTARYVYWMNKLPDFEKYHKLEYRFQDGEIPPEYLSTPDKNYNIHFVNLVYSDNNTLEDGSNPENYFNQEIIVRVVKTISGYKIDNIGLVEDLLTE